MGEIADSIINGELCAICGVYLEPKELVHMQHNETDTDTMPSNGDGYGVPVLCTGCISPIVADFARETKQINAKY